MKLTHAFFSPYLARYTDPFTDNPAKQEPAMILSQGKAGYTRQVASTDTGVALPDNVLYANKINASAGVAIAAFLSVETADIRYALGTTPTTGGLGHLLAAGSSIRIVGAENVAALKIVSAAAGTPGTCHVTAEFANGVTPTA